METIKKYRTLFLILLLLIVVGIGFIFFKDQIQSLIAVIKSEQTHPAVVFIAFLVLPILFFPISVLLVLIGIRFGAVPGVVMMFGLIPVHLVVSFFISRSILNAPLKRIVTEKVHPHFWSSNGYSLKLGFLFMAIPGLPYTVKNYLLPLSGIPFRDYFLISWFVQSVMGIPIVVIGDAASDWNLDLVLFLALLLLVIYLILQHIRKRYTEKEGRL